ncbi:hypothetical protein ACE1SV_70400 [Streptomyces sp. E-15]
MSSRQQPTNPYEYYIRLHDLVSGFIHPDGWREGSLLRAALQSVELTLHCAAEAHDDPRPSSFTEPRVQRLLDMAEDHLRALGRLPGLTPPPGMAVARTAEDRPSPGLAVLDRLPDEQVRPVLDAFTQAADRLGYGLGVEHQVEAARTRLGLPAHPPKAVTLDYRHLVAPEDVLRLVSPVADGPEDHLFASAHQITESWLHIAHAYVDAAVEAAEEQRWENAAGELRAAASAVDRASDSGQVLELMDLADYHRLRVHLRDGSGAQSRAARELPRKLHAALRPLTKSLTETGATLAGLIAHRAGDTARRNYLTALKLLSADCQNFLFEHYLLALGVLGSRSTGTLGYEVAALAKRAAQPLLPEVNEAHHDLVQYTNLQYAADAGSLITRREAEAGVSHAPRPTTDPGTATGTADEDALMARVRTYFKAIEERAPDTWLALFDAEHGRLYDQPTARPFVGRDHLKVFISAMFDTFHELSTEVTGLTVDGDRATAHWTVRAVSYQGAPVTYSGREEFSFTEDASIATAVVHWSPPEVAARLWPDIAA